MSYRKTRFVIRLFIALVAWSFVGASSAEAPDTLILSRSGNLPIILTVPHGGQEVVPGASLRTRGPTLLDANTIELAEALSKRLRTVLGNDPYLVAARFSRKYIDANRAEADAFELADANPVYWAYHNRISAFISEIRQKFPNGALLLDIHGQSEDPNVVHRGTRNGATVTRLIQKHGPVALVGPNSILGFLQLKGYKVFPPNTPLNDPPEDRRFDGGHTVTIYGSQNLNGIDAVQLEVGRYLRTDSFFIDNLARGIVLFYKTYLITGGKIDSRVPNTAADSQ